MKGKKLIALLLALLVTGAMLTGCGAATESTAADNAASMQMPAAEAVEEEALYSSADSASAVPQSAGEEKLITRVYIDAETEDLDSFVAGLGEKISALGGYIEYQDIYNGSAYASRRYRNASMTIRIPAQQVGGFVEQVKGSSNVISYSESQENVTLTYVATESRMKALETEQERLLELMEKAETMSDLLEIEARLTEVRSDLESVTSQLRVLSNQVDYATVELSVSQVEVYTEVEEQTVWQRISSGFGKNLKNIGDGLVDFFVWLTVYSPQLLILAAAVAAVILLIRRGRKRAKKNPASPPFEIPTEEEKK